MSANVNLYQSSVRAISDEELTRLTGELYAEYFVSSDEDSYWTDDAAAKRYFEMRIEARRRQWAANHPNDPEGLTQPRLTMSDYLKEIYRTIVDSLDPPRDFAGFRDAPFFLPEAIGSTVQIRKPFRFV